MAAIMQGVASEKKKVVAYAIPMMGHATPVLRLCAALASRGHEVTFATSAALGSKISATCSSKGFHFRGLEDGLTDETLKTPDAGRNPRFEEFCQRHTELLAALVHSIGPALILSDFASGAGFAVARAKRTALVINMAVPATVVQGFTKLGNLAALSIAKRIKSGEVEMLDFAANKIRCAMQRTLTVLNDCAALGASDPLPPNFFLCGPQHELRRCRRQG